MDPKARFNVRFLVGWFCVGLPVFCLLLFDIRGGWVSLVDLCRANMILTGIAAGDNCAGNGFQLGYCHPYGREFVLQKTLRILL